MSLVMLLGSLAAVIGLAFMAGWLRLGGGSIGDADEARRIAQEALPGFAAEAAWVSTDGLAALVIGPDGAALIKQHGTQPAVRHVARPISARVDPTGLIVESGDRMFGPLRLSLPQPERDRLLTLL